MRYTWVRIVTGDYMRICIGIGNDTRFAGRGCRSSEIRAGVYENPLSQCWYFYDVINTLEDCPSAASDPKTGPYKFRILNELKSAVTLASCYLHQRPPRLISTKKAGPKQCQDISPDLESGGASENKPCHQYARVIIHVFDSSPRGTIIYRIPQ